MIEEDNAEKRGKDKMSTDKDNVEGEEEQVG